MVLQIQTKGKSLENCIFEILVGIWGQFLDSGDLSFCDKSAICNTHILETYIFKSVKFQSCICTLRDQILGKKLYKNWTL